MGKAPEKCPGCGKEFDKDTPPEDSEDSENEGEISLEEDNTEKERGTIVLDEATENPMNKDDNMENEQSVTSEEINKTELSSDNNSDTKEEVPSFETNANNNYEKLRKLFKPTIIVSVVCLIVAVICLIFAININAKYNQLSKNYSSISSQLRKAKDKKKELKSQNTALLEENSNLKLENDELSNGAQKQLSDIKNAYEKGEWQNVIDLSSALHEKYNGSEEDIEAQQLAKTSQENIDKQKAAEEAEKAKGYETGITYDQLARTPDDYEGQKIKFYGKVIQVMESDSSVTIRLAVNDDYDTILYGQYSKSIVSSRVLEDDYITVYGTSVGTISYQSTMGGTITIPGVYIEKIEQ